MSPINVSSDQSNGVPVKPVIAAQDCAMRLSTAHLCIKVSFVYCLVCWLLGVSCIPLYSVVGVG
jgi:hypothetical protein